MLNARGKCGVGPGGPVGHRDRVTYMVSYIASLGKPFPLDQPTAAAIPVTKLAGGAYSLYMLHKLRVLQGIVATPHMF